MAQPSGAVYDVSQSIWRTRMFHFADEELAASETVIVALAESEEDPRLTYMWWPEEVPQIVG